MGGSDRPGRGGAAAPLSGFQGPGTPHVHMGRAEHLASPNPPGISPTGPESVDSCTPDDPNMHFGAAPVANRVAYERPMFHERAEGAGGYRSVKSQLRFRTSAAHSERSIAIRMSSWKMPSW